VLKLNPLVLLLLLFICYTITLSVRVV
jgi:hypothetical protein